MNFDPKRPVHFIFLDFGSKKSAGCRRYARKSQGTEVVSLVTCSACRKSVAFQRELMRSRRGQR